MQKRRPPPEAHRVDRWLVAWSDRVIGHAPWVVLLAVLLAAGALNYIGTHLGINTDTADMLSEDLPYRQTYNHYKQQFPQYTDTLQVVIDGQTAGLAQQAARTLAERLRHETGLVQWVYFPQGDEFFARQALLYLDTGELQDLTNRLAGVQPFLGRLTADMSLNGLFRLLDDLLMAAESGTSIEAGELLTQISEGITAVLDDRFYRLSWHRLMQATGDAADSTDQRRVVTVKPVLDYSNLLPAGPVLARIRDIAREQDLSPERGVAVRITGGLALSHEELNGVRKDASRAGLLSLVLVSLILIAGLRSATLLFASLLTLVIGLIWTAAFAAFAIGGLNLISVAFAVLYIGLGVDYSIHYCLDYRRQLTALRGSDDGHTAERRHRALRLTSVDIGRSLTFCAITTGTGFLAFVPTDFTGVSELGLIGGAGMLISLFVNLTVLPALLALLPLRDSRTGTCHTAGPACSPEPHRGPAPATIVSATLLVALLAAALAPQARFDVNPLNLRDPDTESVRTWQDLVADSSDSPWTAVALAADAGIADRLKQRMQRLETVDKVRTLADFVPRQQTEKLALIEELDLILGSELAQGGAAGAPATPLTTDSGKAIARVTDRLGVLLSSTDRHLPWLPQAQGLHRSLLELRDRLAGSTPAAAMQLLTQLQESLLATLPSRLQALASALDAGPFTTADLPDTLRQRWRSDAGSYRLEIFPREDLGNTATLSRFVSQIRSVDPAVTDSPVVILESGKAVVLAFQQAFLLALLLITLLLTRLLPRRGDVLLVLGPLLLAGLLTTAVLVLLDIPFNFANVIALPLLLGIGVDNGIHMVHRLRHPERGTALMSSSTVYAVWLSTLTTIGSFGTLALSAHRGMASMGQVLTIGMLMMLLCSLVILPALAAWRTNRAAGDTA